MIGIGQSLRGDDAAGIEAVRAWRASNSRTAEQPDVVVETLELPGLGLLDTLEQADSAIIVDALQPKGKPGQVLGLTMDELGAFTADTKSAHGWGVAETLRMGRQLNPALASVDVHIIGIEGSQFEVGKDLSSEVRRALPRASNAIQEEVERALKPKAR